MATQTLLSPKDLANLPDHTRHEYLSGLDVGLSKDYLQGIQTAQRRGDDIGNNGWQLKDELHLHLVEVDPVEGAKALAQEPVKDRNAIIKQLNKASVEKFMEGINEARQDPDIDIGTKGLELKDYLNTRLAYGFHFEKPGDLQRVEDLLKYSVPDMKSIVYGRVGETEGLSAQKTETLLSEVRQVQADTREHIDNLTGQRGVDPAELRGLSTLSFKLQNVGRALGGHLNYIEGKDKDVLELSVGDLVHMKTDDLRSRLDEITGIRGADGNKTTVGEAKLETLIMEAKMWTQSGMGDGKHDRLVDELASSYVKANPNNKVGITLEKLEALPADRLGASIELIPDNDSVQALGKALNRVGRLSPKEEEVLEALQERVHQGVRAENVLQWEPAQVNGFINNYSHQEIQSLKDQMVGMDLDSDGETISGMIENRQAAISNPETAATLNILRDSELQKLAGMNLEEISTVLETNSAIANDHLGQVALQMLQVDIRNGLPEGALDLLVAAGEAVSEASIVAEIKEEKTEPKVERPREEVQEKIAGTEPKDLGTGGKVGDVEKLAALIPLSEVSIIETVKDIGADGLQTLQTELTGMLEKLSDVKLERAETALAHIGERLTAITNDLDNPISDFGR